MNCAQLSTVPTSELRPTLKLTDCRNCAASGYLYKTIAGIVVFVLVAILELIAHHRKGPTFIRCA